MEGLWGRFHDSETGKTPAQTPAHADSVDTAAETETSDQIGRDTSTSDRITVMLSLKPVGLRRDPTALSWTQPCFR